MEDARRILRLTENNACRKLFPDANEDQSWRMELKKEEDSMVNEASNRWNFDFKSDKPLDGPYKWKLDTAPTFYHPTTVSGKRKAPSYYPGENESEKENEQGSLCKRHCYEPLNMLSTPTSKEPAVHSKKAPKLQKQTSIKDFYHAKRRNIQSPCNTGQES